MTERKPSRADRVGEIEKHFQEDGETERNSFSRAIVVDHISNDMGLSMDHALAFERVFAQVRYARIANGLRALHDKRLQEEELATTPSDIGEIES